MSQQDYNSAKAAEGQILLAGTPDASGQLFFVVPTALTALLLKSYQIVTSLTHL